MLIKRRRKRNKMAAVGAPIRTSPSCTVSKSTCTCFIYGTSEDTQSWDLSVFSTVTLSSHSSSRSPTPVQRCGVLNMQTSSCKESTPTFFIYVLQSAVCILCKVRCYILFIVTKSQQGEEVYAYILFYLFKIF